MFTPSIILLFIISFLDLALGLFVYLKNPKERVNLSFALFTLVGLIWINASFFEDELNNISQMFFLLKLDFVSGLFTACLVLLFCLNVSKSEIARNKWFKIFLYAIPLVFSVLIFFTKSVISGYQMTSGVISPVYGGAYPAYVLFLGIFLFGGLSNILWRYRKSPLEDQAKFIYLLIGLFLTSAIAFATNIVLVDFIKASPHYGLYSRFGLFSSVFVILFSGYAIIRHHLLNLKVIATELLSLGILVFTLLQTLKSETLPDLIGNGIVFVILLTFVIMLVRSVEQEVKRKEELQLLYDQLAAANEKLQELDQARADFMSIASHQLRTPLTAIKGFSSLLLEKATGSLTTSQENMITKIATSSERMAQLVEDYLNLTRIESGKLEYTLTKQRLEDICQDVVDTLELKAKEKNLSLIFNRPNAALPEVMIDGPKVLEVISNLVDNAIKYTPEGNVTVDLAFRTQTETEPSDRIKITVSDTGMGISEAELPHLFAKFGRGTNEERLKIKGTGLGLYVGKVMIENNGGKIWAESDGEGKGSRFIVEIPVKPSKAPVRSGWGGSA